MYGLIIIQLFFTILSVNGYQGTMVCANRFQLGKEIIKIGERDSIKFSTQAGYKYRNNVRCSVHFARKGEAKCQLSITCDKFKIKPSAFCRHDFLKINEKRHCGTTRPSVTMKYDETKRQYLKVLFKSHKRSPGATGAKCLVRCLPTTPTITPTVPSPCFCGLANRRARIVGGVPTEENEYPWQVKLLIKTGLCGGSLISNLWILTASHCIYDKEGTEIKATEIEAILQKQKRKIEVIVGHSKYDNTNVNYDFALLKMKKAVTFSNYIRPICLPKDDTNNYDGYISTVTGWGRTSSDGAISKSLQEVDVKVITSESCKNDYGYPKSWITEQMLCAMEETGQGGKDACQGDSGGPLVTKETDSDGMTAGQNYELIGVVSWGIGCANETYPGVYARVTKQLDWIREEIAGSYTCLRE